MSCIDKDFVFIVTLLYYNNVLYQVKSNVEGQPPSYACMSLGCPQADKLYKKKDSLLKHWSEAHAPSHLLTVACKHCDMKCISEKVLKMHMHHKHNEKREEKRQKIKKEKGGLDSTQPSSHPREYK